MKSSTEHPDLPPQVKKTTKSTSDTATLNVIARLCKSNQGKSALNAVIAEIQQALGIKPDKWLVSEEATTTSKGPSIALHPMTAQAAAVIIISHPS